MQRDHRDAEREAWAASVKARLGEAILHLAHGIDTPWGQLPCKKYPHCLGGPVVRPILPEGYSFASVSDLAVMTFDGEWHFGAEAEALMHGSATATPSLEVAP